MRSPSLSIDHGDQSPAELYERAMMTCFDAASLLQVLEAAICDTEPSDVPDPSHTRVLLELVRARLLDVAVAMAQSSGQAQRGRS